jgi:hypothetical protein
VESTATTAAAYSVGSFTSTGLTYTASSNTSAGRPCWHETAQDQRSKQIASGRIGGLMRCLATNGRVCRTRSSSAVLRCAP